MFSLSDYQFHLPDKLIAETAAQPAPDARLIIFSKNEQKILHEGNFWDLPHFLDDSRVLFFNNSKVLRARIPLVNQEIFYENFSKKITNGEIFFLKNISQNRFEALVRPGKKFKIDTILTLGKFSLSVVENTDFGRIFEIAGGEISELLETFGELPLPPYIEYSKEKEKDYQSIFASKNGSVAAPTASLHFDENLLSKIQNPREFVTLHIGLGTFKTIDTDDIRNYEIHSETAEIDKKIFEKIFHYKNNSKKILAIGTTACRTLESLPSLWKNLDENFLKNFDENARNFWEKISEKSDKNWIQNVIVHE